MSGYERIIPLLEVHPESRVKVIKKGDAYAAPGICIMCRNAPSESRSLIDFGKTMQMHGAIYFCDQCFDEICRTIGYIKVDGSELDSAETHIKYLELENKALRKELSAIGELIEHINSLYSIRNSTPDSNIIGPSSDDEISVQTRKNEQRSRDNKANKSSGSRKSNSSKTDESDSESELSDIRGDATDDIDEFLSL